MPLTSSERKKLRQQAQTLADDLSLGKAGLSPGFVARLKALLATKELVKLRFGKDVTGEARQALAEEVTAASATECVAILGRTLLLYRKKDAKSAGPGA